jgi:outer membrane lipopolysaccharide assembly protein LptE/RlpB
MKKVVWSLILFFYLFGCGYTPVPILPNYIKGIDVLPFEDRTSSRYNLQLEITNKIIEELILDGRVDVVSPERSDAQLRGQIVSFTREPLSYDTEGNVTEYKLWILVEAEFFDKVKDAVLWRDEFEHSLIYAESVTEELEAIEELSNEVVRDIFNRILEF